MLDQTVAFHQWLWQSSFVIPLLAISIIRVVERRFRRGTAGAWHWLLGSTYILILVLIGPGVAVLLNQLPFPFPYPLGILRDQFVFEAAFVTFAMICLEPEIEGGQLGRGLGKAIGLSLFLQIVMFRLDATAAAGSAESALTIAMLIWTVSTAFLNLVYWLQWRTIAANTVMVVVFLGGMFLAFATLPVLGVILVMAVLVLGFPPILAVSKMSPGAADGTDYRDWYRLGLEQLRPRFRGRIRLRS